MQSFFYAIVKVVVTEQLLYGIGQLEHVPDGQRMLNEVGHLGQILQTSGMVLR
jgi:hypothetical protein